MSSPIACVVDIGGTKTLMWLVNPDGSPIDGSEYSFPSVTSDGPHATAAAIAKEAKSVCQRLEIPLESVSSACVLPPAPILKGRISFESNLGHPEWIEVLFADVLAEVWPELGSVQIANDAKAAGMGIAEWVHDNLPRYHDELIAVLTMGTGWGGCLVHIGDVNSRCRLQVGQGRGCEFGQMKIALDPTEFWLEKPKGQLVSDTAEYFGGRAGNVAQLKRIFVDDDLFPDHKLRQYSKDGNQLDVDMMSRNIRRLAVEGDELCWKLFVELQAKAMGRLFAQIALCNDPALFVIGGGAMMDQEVPEQMRSTFRSLVSAELESELPDSYLPPEVIFYPHGDQAALVGAVELTRQIH